MREDDPRADEIKALCRDHAEDMVRNLADIANDATEKAAPRVVAAKALLERGFGAPERRIEKSVDVTVHDHRMAHLTALRKLADQRQPVNDIVDADFDEIEEEQKQLARRKN